MTNFVSLCLTALIVGISMHSPEWRFDLAVSFGRRPTVQCFNGYIPARVAKEYLYSVGYGSVARFRSHIEHKSVSLVKAVVELVNGLRRQAERVSPVNHSVPPTIPTSTINIPLTVRKPSVVILIRVDKDTVLAAVYLYAFVRQLLQHF